ncbi:GLPGLI family protein [uncultured Polaribacter sp.]|uniref:GLPGLI family protein n=1 Tax=uncultured Polaribacter sp. TaxID=174711 RepID=UPI0026385986|nr:GLPGLI family protein [uncultured Polaribacter sp.]
MQKKTPFILLLLFSKIIFSQTNLIGIIEYQSSISENTIRDYVANKREKLDITSRKTYDEIYLSSLKIKSTLHFSNDESIFKVEENLTSKNRKLNNRLIESWSGGNKVFYTNSSLKYNDVKNCKTLGECFIIRSKLKKWNLTQETKQISGYTCYKAVRMIAGRKAKKEIVAWYSPSIPVNFGPKGENGLPGLILELELGDIHFMVKKIILNPKEGVIINKLNNGKIIKEKDFKILVGKAADNLFGKRN